MSEQKFLDNEVLSKDFMSDYNLDGCFKVSKQNEKEKIFEKYKDINELNRVILDAFVSRIEVGKEMDNSNRSINIEWNLYTIG